MADEHLSDDPRTWPDDPFRLLGVEPPVSEQDLKRAYTRLIRRFKPEHHPEQFRRIREAYENAQERQRWFGFFQIVPPPEVTSTAEPASPTPASPEPTESAAGNEREVPPRPVIIDPVEDAWKLAVSNCHPEAYARLLDLDRTRRDHADLALQLYWLLTVQPELDSERSRHTWLFAALTRSRLSGAAVALYKRELDSNHIPVLAGPYGRVLEIEAPGENVLQLARLRLAVAGFRGAWAVLDADVRMLSQRTSQFGDVAWLTYLVAVMGYACFDRTTPVFEQCQQLLGGLRHLELREAWAFDQIEERQQMADAWRSASLAPEPVREVVRDAMVSPADGWKQAMRRAAAWVTDDPVTALRQFDLACHMQECRQVLTVFQRLLDDHAKSRTGAYPPGLIRGLIREFLTRHQWVGGNYARIRVDLIRLLIREVIAPDELVEACEIDTASGPRTLAQHLRTDPVLLLVWQTAHAVL